MGEPVPAEGRWKALAFLAVALVLAMTTWFSASAVVPQLRSEWGLSSGAAAWLTIAVQLGFVTGALVSSILNLSDVISPRHVMLGGSVGAAVANVLLAYATGPAAAIPLRFATGFFLAGVYPPALKLMSTWFARDRGLALGVLVGALTVGSAGPHLVNGLGGLEWRMVVYATSALTLTVGSAGPHLVNGLGGLEWRMVVYATSALTLLGGIVAVLVGDGPYPFPRATFDPRQARRVFSNRGIRLASLGYLGHMWELYAMWTWFVVFFGDAVRATRPDPGTAPAFATFAVIGVGGLGCWAGGLLGDRWGRTRTTALMMAVSGLCAIAIGLLFGRAPSLLLVIGLVWGFSVVADSAQFSTIVTELADQAYVGTALTLQLALGFTLTVATIWLVPALEGLIGWRWTFALLAPGPALGVVAMLRLKATPEARRIAHGRA